MVTYCSPSELPHFLLDLMLEHTGPVYSFSWQYGIPHSHHGRYVGDFFLCMVISLFFLNRTVLHALARDCANMQEFLQVFHVGIRVEGQGVCPSSCLLTCQLSLEFEPMSTVGYPTELSVSCSHSQGSSSGTSFCLSYHLS